MKIFEKMKHSYHKKRLDVSESLESFGARLWAKSEGKRWENQKQPAVELEETANLHGIAGRYALPKVDNVEMTPQEFEKKIHTNYFQIRRAQHKLTTAKNPEKWESLLRRYFRKQHGWIDEIVASNPQISNIFELKTMATNNSAAFDVLMGVSSGFNIDDIDWYTRQGNVGFLSETIPSWNKLNHRLESHIGQGMGYVPSEKTMLKIAEQALEQDLRTNDSIPPHSETGNTAMQDIVTTTLDGETHYARLPKVKYDKKEHGVQDILDVRERLTSFHEKECEKMGQKDRLDAWRNR